MGWKDPPRMFVQKMLTTLFLTRAVSSETDIAGSAGAGIGRGLSIAVTAAPVAAVSIGGGMAGGGVVEGGVETGSSFGAGSWSEEDMRSCKELAETADLPASSMCLSCGKMSCISISAGVVVADRGDVIATYSDGAVWMLENTPIKTSRFIASVFSTEKNVNTYSNIGLL